MTPVLPPRPSPSSNAGLGLQPAHSDAPASASQSTPLGHAIAPQRLTEIAKGLVRPAGPAQMCD